MGSLTSIRGGLVPGLNLSPGKTLAKTFCQHENVRVRCYGQSCTSNIRTGLRRVLGSYPINHNPIHFQSTSVMECSSVLTWRGCHTQSVMLAPLIREVIPMLYIATVRTGNLGLGILVTIGEYCFTSLAHF